MNIEIKKSKKPIKYEYAIRFMESRLNGLNQKKDKELIWILEHDDLYTAGTSFKETDILDKSIKVIKTNRGGKITYHGHGQLICYFVIDLKKRNKDIRKFISVIETIAQFENIDYKINTFSFTRTENQRYKENLNIKKVAAIGIKVSKWIGYHGFAININNDLKKYDSIIPCGIKDKGVTNLKKIIDQNYKDFGNKLIKNFIFNLGK